MKRLKLLAFVISLLCNVNLWAQFSDSTISDDDFEYEVTSPTTVKVLRYTNLTKSEITVPEKVEGYTVTEIGSDCFNGCLFLKKVNFPQTIKKICQNAFFKCSRLRSLNIPKSVESFGIPQAWYSENLESITVEEGNPFYDSRNGCNAVINSKTNQLLLGCKNSTVPEGITSIATNAFIYCKNLTYLSFPKSLRFIEDAAFSCCSGLDSVTFQGNLVSIGNSAFLKSGLKSVFIPKSVLNIGKHAFSCCPNLKSIVVEEGNPVYDSRESCNALIETSTNTLISGSSSAFIPEGIESIADAAFSYTGIDSITIPSSVVKIGQMAFDKCNKLEYVYIPETVTIIEKCAFRDCSSLEKIIIPNSVNQIQDETFKGCEKLDSIVIPETVTYIGSQAFEGTKNCNVVMEGSTPPNISYDTFGTEGNSSVVVPTGSSQKYNDDYYWSQVGNISEYSPATTGIGRTTKTDDSIATYTLDGRRMNNASAKGVYIRDGKKYIVTSSK